MVYILYTLVVYQNTCFGKPALDMRCGSTPEYESYLAIQSAKGSFGGVY